MVTKIDKNELTITEIGSLLNDKSISVKELVQEYLDCIERYDQGINGLNSIIEINPDVIQIAEQLDSKRSDYKSELFGVPILLKDNINTADKMHTSAGSLALANSYAPYDAEIVAALRAKGAVILGKTNMTEFANFMTQGMPSGYSSRGGQTQNPYNPKEDPSGSSTGSAVAVSANLCMAALGTDTSGSVISPALTNGIVGFRPSAGTLGQKGIVPISFTLDMAGPMTRTVTDTIIMFSELTNTIIQSSAEISLKGIAIGVNQLAIKNMNDEETKKTHNMLRKLKEAGATIKHLDVVTIPKSTIQKFMKYEFKHSINQYLSSLANDFPIQTLKDVIEFNNQHKEIALKYGQTELIDAEKNTTGDLSETIYTDLLKDREEAIGIINEQMKDIDALILFKDSPIVQYAGLPGIAIPCGLYNNGMPRGINITAHNNEDLLKIAHIMEQIVGSRKEPKSYK